MCQGIVNELEGIHLGDERLNQRSRIVIERLAADPSASINAACDGWSETQAAYRFFDNDQVDPEKILQPHRQATERRIAEQPVVLIVQDTTELDYTDHPPHDAGVLDAEHRFGLYDHSHIAFTPERLCLGVLSAEFFSRDADHLGETRQRRLDPIETKESYRWLKGYRLACELQAAHPQTQIISVADCESDIYDIFLEPEEHEAPADFVIRAKQNRCLTEQDPDAGVKVYYKVLDEVAASEVVATRQVELPPTPKREARQATLEVRAQQVHVRPPAHRRELPAVTYNVVLVEEVGGPDDGTAVSWLLITTLPIDSADAVLRVVDSYVARWPVEVFFRVYKTGCRVEDIQLETNDRLLPCLALYKVIAWRVMYLTFLGRECPELPCDTVFADQEWKAVWKIDQDEPLPKTAPSLSQFIPLLAKLGGYNARKQDRPPGPQAIWVGIRRMTDFALAWTAFGTAPENHT